MLGFADVQDFVQSGLSSRDYAPLPLLSPGPAGDATVQKNTPGAIVFITIGDGAGFTTELLFDRPFIRIRTVGKQNDYGYAEALAQDIDNILCAVDGNTVIGSTNVLYITRAGGSPSLLEKDLSDRYHFTCTYITEAVSGL